MGSKTGNEPGIILALAAVIVATAVTLTACGAGGGVRSKAITAVNVSMQKKTWKTA